MGERVLRPLPSGDPLGSTLIVPTVTIFDGTENLRITSASSVATVLTIYIRMRLPTGVVEPMVLTHTPNSDRSIRDAGLSDRRRHAAQSAHPADDGVAAHR
jgi:hypothetical protein